jgi:hypothetical protein
MGYSTDFKGTLGFKDEPTGKQLAKLNSIFGEDRREHKDWPAYIGKGYFYHIDLELNEDFDGVEWNGTEKTGDMDAILNYVTLIMRQTWPDFAFTGKFFAQGEEAGDVYWIVLDEDGIARRQKPIWKPRNLPRPLAHTAITHLSLGRILKTKH